MLAAELLPHCCAAEVAACSWARRPSASPRRDITGSASWAVYRTTVDGSGSNDCLPRLSVCRQLLPKEGTTCARNAAPDDNRAMPGVTLPSSRTRAAVRSVESPLWLLVACTVLPRVCLPNTCVLSRLTLAPVARASVCAVVERRCGLTVARSRPDRERATRLAGHWPHPHSPTCSPHSRRQRRRRSGSAPPGTAAQATAPALRPSRPGW